MVGAFVASVSVKKTVQTRTSAVGQFHLPAMGHWGLAVVISDGPSPPRGMLRIEATGYRPYQLDIGVVPGEVVQGITIPLMPTSSRRAETAEQHQWPPPDPALWRPGMPVRKALPR